MSATREPRRSRNSPGVQTAVDPWDVRGSGRGPKRPWEQVTSARRDPDYRGQRVEGGKALFQDDDDEDEEEEEEPVDGLYSYHCDDFKGLCEDRVRDGERGVLSTLHCVYSGVANTVSGGAYNDWGAYAGDGTSGLLFPLDDLDVNALQPKCSYEIEDDPDVLRLNSPISKLTPSSRTPKQVFITNPFEGENGSENDRIVENAARRLCSQQLRTKRSLGLDRMQTKSPGPTNEDSIQEFHNELERLKQFIESKGGLIPATLLKIYNKKNPRFLRLLESVLGSPVRQLSRIFENNVPWGIFVIPPTYVDDCLKSTLMFSTHQESRTPPLPSPASVSPSKRNRRSPQNAPRNRRSPGDCPTDRVVTKSNFKITFLTNRP